GTAALSLRFAPITALAVIATVLVGGPTRLIGIVLVAANLGFAAYAYLNPMSSLLPGTMWLMMSLLVLEVADRRSARREALVVLSTGYASLVAFIAAYTLVIVQSPAYIGAISARMLIEALALGAFFYWWSFEPESGLRESPLWSKAHPRFLELLLVSTSV